MSMYHRLTGLAVLGFALAQPAAPASAACRIALVLAIAILMAVAVDFLALGGQATLFLARKTADLVDWIAFWR